eukprot:5451980-Pyramimonas_sp.AAC.1
MDHSLTPAPYVCTPRYNNCNIPRRSGIHVNLMTPKGYPQGRQRKAPPEPQQRGNKGRSRTSKVVPMSLQGYVRYCQVRAPSRKCR